MNQKVTPEMLTILRNELDLSTVIFALGVPWRRDDQKLRFICPRCQGLDTSVHPTENLGRCFSCSSNYNPIDLAMMFQKSKFRTAVEWLLTLKKIAETDEGKVLLNRQAMRTQLK
jgi:DNA primase